MAGHSKWSKIKRGKAVEDAKRGALFTKYGNAIAIAARAGDDPAINFALRLAIDRAKSINMPATNIQRAIDRGSGKLGGEQIQEVLYEGYGPGGVAVLVAAATDNVNRTYPEVRTAFTKHGGSIAEKGAVAFQFEKKGEIRVKGTSDEIVMKAIDAGAEDVTDDDDYSVVYTDAKDFARVRDKLKELGLEIQDAQLTYIPQNSIIIEDDVTAAKIDRMMDALDELDDVTETYTNFEYAEGIAEEQ